MAKNKGWMIDNDYSNIIPTTPGNYALYLLNLETHNKTLLYIGTACNLYIRLKKHPIILTLRALYNFPYTVLIKIKQIENKNMRLQQESNLIKKLTPKINYA